MSTPVNKGEGGVKNTENSVNVVYEWPHWILLSHAYNQGCSTSNTSPAFFCFLMKIKNKSIYGINTPWGVRGGQMGALNTGKNSVKF